MTDSTPKTAPQTNPILRFRAKPTRGSAIKAKCAECMGCNDTATEPGFRTSIRECPSPMCPLYPFRPYQKREKVAENSGFDAENDDFDAENDDFDVESPDTAIFHAENDMFD